MCRLEIKVKNATRCVKVNGVGTDDHLVLSSEWLSFFDRLSQLFLTPYFYCVINDGHCIYLYISVVHGGVPIITLHEESKQNAKSPQNERSLWLSHEVIKKNNLIPFFKDVCQLCSITNEEVDKWLSSTLDGHDLTIRRLLEQVDSNQAQKLRAVEFKNLLDE